MGLTGAACWVCLAFRPTGTMGRIYLGRRVMERGCRGERARLSTEGISLDRVLGGKIGW